LTLDKLELITILGQLAYCCQAKNHADFFEGGWMGRNRLDAYI
jgi:hypothetical protein